MDETDPGAAASARVRAYRSADADALWSLKRGFELGLGDGTGGDEKRELYEAKLAGDYRERWLDWVDRCVDEDPACVQVAEREPKAETDVADDAGGDGPDLLGYVFLLPESLSFVWDAAVLNEIYLAPDARGTGLADDLMKSAVACARRQELPLDRLVLDVDRENARARAFYERHGFSHWGEMVARKL